MKIQIINIDHRSPSSLGNPMFLFFDSKSCSFTNWAFKYTTHLYTE